MTHPMFLRPTGRALRIFGFTSACLLMFSSWPWIRPTVQAACDPVLGTTELTPFGKLLTTCEPLICAAHIPASGELHSSTSPSLFDGGILLWLQVRKHPTRIKPGSSDEIKGVADKSNGIMVKELQRQARGKMSARTRHML